MEECAKNEWRYVVETYAPPMVVQLHLASLNLLKLMHQIYNHS